MNCASQIAGPQRIQRELARQLRRLADIGVPEVADASLTADHFLLSTSGAVSERSHYGAAALSVSDRTALITAEVRAFLHGCLPHPASGVSAAAELRSAPPHR
ncbi:TetR/AcrR family transcriptional regulator C-terminal domain-containing protein [Streptomyces macrosporus]|uniref:TetR/AcrR family transcriptional regulator C-terminal domain-containing protein n=1 Tax=Streptomyces macrosporus TaxID=44032 RepID=UPI0031DC6682